MVDFVSHAAFIGGFSLNFTKPPEWIYNHSSLYFGDDNSFDYCVYAVSLGYLDMCIASYSLTRKRTKITPFFEVFGEDVYLYIKSEPKMSLWQEFYTHIPKIFGSFTIFAWMCIIVYLLLLGLIMLWHEYKAPGSAFPAETHVSSKNKDGGYKIEIKKIPMVRHIFRTLYQSLLTFSEQSYSQGVYTLGGKVHLLAMSFFVLIIISLYTANIAAILTTNINDNRISNIQDAIKLGYNFCADRSVVERMIELYGMNENSFVPDPSELGGDGKPGFSCPKCNSRSRTFENMKRNHNDPSLYCNAAISTDEDLVVFQKSEKFCDVLRVGEPLLEDYYGLPISRASFPGLSSMFHSLKNNDDLVARFKKNGPESNCQSADGTNALTVIELSGLWVVCTAIVVIGLLVKLFVHVSKKNNPERQQDIERFDQWGEPSSFDVVIDNHVYDKDEYNLRKSFAEIIHEEHDANECESSNGTSINFHSNEVRKRRA